MLSESTGIPTLLASSWSQFVEEWCLGVLPVTSRNECERALSALSEYWPERVHALIAGPTRD